jgi:hypothetical protein
MATVKAIIHGSWLEYADEFSYSVHSCDMSDYGYFIISEVELEVPELSLEMLRKLVHAGLMKKKAKVLAEAWVQAQTLQDQADKLLALPAPAPEEEATTNKYEESPF